MFPPEHFTFQDHPQSNGLVECFHLSLKTSQRTQLAGPDWVDHLLLVMLSLCSVSRDDSGFSTTEALFRAPLCLPGEFLDSDKVHHDAILERIQSALRGLVLPPSHHQPTSAAQVPAALTSADFVFVCKDQRLYSIQINHYSSLLICDTTVCTQ